MKTVLPASPVYLDFEDLLVSMRLNRPDFGETLLYSFSISKQISARAVPTVDCAGNNWKVIKRKSPRPP
jgi:hypothetical protein